MAVLLVLLQINGASQRFRGAIPDIIHSIDARVPSPGRCSSMHGTRGARKNMEAIANSPGPMAEIMTRIEAVEVDGALALLTPIVRERPSDGQAHTLIGICQAQQGNLSGAIKSLETALL